MATKSASLRKALVDKEPPKLLKLDIGSGGFSTDDSFTSVDAYTKADIQAYMWDLPFEDNEVDMIWCSNALEHISKFQIVPTLTEWLRVLKPNGKAQIIVPDLEWACRFWLENPGVNWTMDIIYGHQKHEGEYHKTGFNEKIIRDYFDIVGGFGIHKIEKIGGKTRKNRREDGALESHVDQGLFNIEVWKRAEDSLPEGLRAQD